MDPETKLSKLKPINYDEIINITNNYKEKSEQSVIKMNNMLKKSKLSKNNSQRIEHKRIWNLESMRLHNQKRNLQRKINSFISLKMSSVNGDNLISDISQFNEKLLDDHETFKTNVTNPVWSLCEDIKEWKLKKSRGYRVPESQPIQDIINSMKVKLKEISLELESEEESLMASLQSEIDQYSSEVHSINVHKKVCTGIPQDTWDIECCDSQILAELLSQYLYLDSHFQRKLDRIEEENNFVDTRYPPTDWSKKEIDLADHLQEMYLQFGNINRNLLLQEILRIVFPNHSKKNLLEIEKYSHCKKVLTEKLQCLISDWKRDREELLVKIKASIIDFNEQILSAQIESQKIQIQKSICLQLSEHVNEWRHKKEQLRLLEESLNEQLKEKEMIAENEKLQRTTAMRNRTKEMIVQYKTEKNKQREKQIEDKQREIEELKEYLKRQAIIDEERINYREDLRQEKLREENLKKEHLLEQQQLAEMRLNQICELVRPHVEADPERILKPTSTWLRHTENVTEQSECDFSIFTDSKVGHRYGIPLNTYNDNEVLANPRFRVENALREAGLINSEYARNVLKSIPANQAQRKDCISSEKNFLKYE